MRHLVAALLFCFVNLSRSTEVKVYFTLNVTRK